MPELVSCPHCGKRLRVPGHLLNRIVKCPSCTKPFTASAEPAGPAPEEESPPAPLPRRRPEAEAFTDRPTAAEDEDDIRPQRRSEENDWEDGDQDDDRPRRQSRRRRRRRATAAGMVMGPAIALLVVGILGILMGVANVVVAATGFGVAPQKQDLPGYMTGRVIGASVSLIWGIVVTLGGWKLMSLQSHGSARTGAIFALLPCNPCCLLGLPIGIWALVVLNQQEVKDAFR